MKKKMIIKSFEFNKRVLYQGILSKDKLYSNIELDKLLMFNSIFISNMNELFSKYNINDKIVSEYKKLLIIYNNNINLLREEICIANNLNYKKYISEEDLIELTPSLMNNLEIRNLNNIKTFEENRLYFISEHKGRYVIINPKIGFETIRIGNVLFNYEKCIKLYLNEVFSNTICFKVLYHKDKICKIDFNGNKNLIKVIKNKIDSNPIIVYNDNIHIKDLKDICSYSIPIEKTHMDVSNVLNKDILFEYPENDFGDFLKIIYNASIDRNVKSIDITIYRIGNNDALADILINAKNNGIKVSVNIEVMASGEIINEAWKHKLDKNNVFVNVYAYNTFKIHAKMFLIKYKDGSYLSNIATGNYNINTSNQYTDFSLVTRSWTVGKTIDGLFNMINGGKLNFVTEDLLVTQYNARDEIMDLIKSESHSDGFIFIKCNSIDDKGIINALNKAAKKGCVIKLVVRGACKWIPKHPNVELRSYVWDKLEHSRIFIFGRFFPIIYLGSLDLLERKINKRIETMIKINDFNIKDKIMGYVDSYLNGSKYWLAFNSDIYERRC